MRILFAYFDFSGKHDSASLEALGECTLDFSTTHDYRVERVPKESDGLVNYSYEISRTKKSNEERIPEGFWGDRIYNVTAIVGPNGSGKSTILYNIIRMVVEGLKPELPFLLVMQKTASDDVLTYCSDDRFVWKDPDELNRELTIEYPCVLRTTKTILLDNTLSLSAIELYEESEHALGPHNPSQITSEQFYNKCLAASINHNVRFSRAGLPNDSMSPFASDVLEMLKTHLRYESYQEVRFLFDRYQQETLASLDEDGDTNGGAAFSVPRPKQLDVSILSTQQMYVRFQQEYGYPDWLSLSAFSVVDVLPKYGLVGVLLANAFLNLFVNAFNYENDDLLIHFYLNYRAVIDNAQLKGITDESALAIELAYAILESCEAVLDSSGRWVEVGIARDPLQLRESIQLVKHYVAHISGNLETLRTILQVVALPERDNDSWLCRIDMPNTTSNEQRRKCMIGFLERYRLVCNPQYYITFSSGMSSGEKSFLKMLTQFRYALDGPVAYSDDTTADKTGNRLVNMFPNQKSVPCDTLFLFLDEADLTYHPEWQRLFISKLASILPQMFQNPYNEDGDDTSGCIDIQVILTTHSPLMLGDFPKACINYLDHEKQTTSSIPRRSTFGENLYTILKDSFFMDHATGEFARQRINSAAQWCADVRRESTHAKIDDEMREKMAEELQKHCKTAQLLPPGIIQSKLIEELEKCASLLKEELPDEMLTENRKMKKRIEELEEELAQKSKELELLRKNGVSSEQNS